MKTLEQYLEHAKTLAQRSAIEKAIHMVRQMPRETQEQFQLAINLIADAMESVDYTKDMHLAKEKAEHALEEISKVTNIQVSLEQSEEELCKHLHGALTKAFRHGTPEEVASVINNLVRYKAAKTLCVVYRSL